MALALYLDAHPKIRRVNYPGLPGFPGHELACAQMKGFGGMLSFYLDETRADPARFVRKLALIVPAVSLGGVDSTICSPAVTSHSTISCEERARLGITDSLFRLSAGIEHIDDLITDLEQALGG
jgi:cystathionine beta-lyase